MQKDSAAYKRARAKADQEYGLGTSVYKSGRIVQLYKQYGGRFTGSKTTKAKGLPRWFQAESWVQVIPYLTSGRRVPCGQGTGKGTGKGKGKGIKGKACRPLRRQNKHTPTTIGELVKRHSRAQVLRAARKKERYPEKRLDWKTLRLAGSRLDLDLDLDVHLL